MSTIDDENPASRLHQPFAALRRSLQEARTADDAERIHVALVDVVDGLIAHVERQARAIDDMRSDLSHKQGVVTRIGGGTFVRPSPPGRLREFASNPNGDRWCLGRDEASGIAHVVHETNPPSGGAVTHIGLGSFLNREPMTPEVLSLLKLIGTLVE